MAEEVSLETEKEALAHGVDAVFPKQDDPTALALNVRALYDLMGTRARVNPNQYKTSLQVLNNRELTLLGNDYKVNPSSCRYFATSLCPRSCANASAPLPSSVRICKSAPWASSILTISRCPFAAAVSNGEYPLA